MAELNNCKSTWACRTSERIVGPRSTDLAKRRAVETIDRGEICDLRPLQAMWLMLRKSKRDETGYCCLGGKTHHFANIVLPRDDHRGHDAAEPGCACGQKDAPAKRVDRRPPDQGVAVEIAVYCRQSPKVRDDEHENGHLIEMLSESTVARRRSEFRGVRPGASLSVEIGDRCPRYEPCCAHSQVLIPALEVEIAKSTPDLAVAYHDDPPPLPVAATRREPCVVEYLCEQLVRYGVSEELAGSASGTESFDQVHECTVSAR